MMMTRPVDQPAEAPARSSLALLYQGSAAEFVEVLKSEALGHSAVRHPYLRRFAQGEFPSMDFAVRDFALQYYVYSSGFTSYLQAVINGLAIKRHREVLSENLREEQGLVGQDCDHTPHAELFDRFRRATGVTEAIERAFVPCTTVRVWRDLFLQKCQSGQVGVGIGAIGIATELLVSDIYRQLLAGIRDHTCLAAEHEHFFELHIECDDGHAASLLAITEELCDNPDVREAVRFGVISSLNLRTAFWDVLLARASQPDRIAHGH
ncbi:iron-containing redox enzyme family protein [uncultured Abyssibacter sp.]|uniref:TenA family transcriptional regulator n=1 Tax=uncultured Abyssibacter sp. TaxID=2320202 RepID=UPI0032B12731